SILVAASSAAGIPNGSSAVSTAHATASSTYCAPILRQYTPRPLVSHPHNGSLPRRCDQCSGWVIASTRHPFRLARTRRRAAWAKTKRAFAETLGGRPLMETIWNGGLDL